MVTKPLLGMAPAVLYLVSLLCLLNLAGADRPVGPDPIENFCSRWWLQSTIKNDTLYIDSGVQKFNASNSTYLGTNTYIMTISLKKSWNWKKDSGDPQFMEVSTEPKNITNNDTGTYVPNNFRGYMFSGPHNSSQVYQFGGSTYMYNQSFVVKPAPSSFTYPLWTYTPGSGPLDTKWDQYDMNQEIKWEPNHGAGADAPDLGLGFYLNGQVDKGTSSDTNKLFDDTDQTYYRPVDGMLVLDLVNPGKAKNISTSTMKENLSRVGGTLDYIPSVGKSGILVALGGQIQPTLQNGKASSKEGKLIDFGSVDVFDIDSYLKNPDSNGKWYQQKTTGEIPPPRIDYCSVSVSAPDNSSHHIIIYGGQNPTLGQPAYFDDVAVLSLPSFRWKQMWSADTPRWGHNCHMAGKQQMITVGGNFTTNTTNPRCDWLKKGVAIFDLKERRWGSVYNSNSGDFTLHDQLLPSTNGTANGNATIGEPVTGWSSVELHKLFWETRWTRPTSWTSKAPPEDATEQQPTTSSTGSSSSDTSSPGNPASNTAAIAGGISGGVVCLGVILAALIYHHHRRRNKPAELPDNHIHLASQTDTPEKQKSHNFELQGINENNPVELDAWKYIEADNCTATGDAAELPGTNQVPGAVPGMPILRFPGDDLPVVPENPGGLRKSASRGSRSSTGSASSRRASSSGGSRRSRESRRSSTAPITGP
ncbi:hypothetical protein DM02DRAFT_733378 [Periconia macrospinosa]|uniref:Kelch repeat protein n=1 Tax=Periconia macrospinosa TaxID=97972 RepID=A0A2V1D780_9PLEO|nr:hypothetical protein DM02DRAFT_733378 [Periconia macrospinosa]